MLKLLKDGTVVADTPEELARYAKIIHQDDSAPKQAAPGPKPRDKGDGAVPLTKKAKRARLIRFLKLIAEAGPSGVLTARLQDELGLIEGGMGMMGTTSHYALKEFDIPKDEVYEIAEGSDGNVALPRARIHEAISKLTGQGSLVDE